MQLGIAMVSCGELWSRIGDSVVSEKSLKSEHFIKV